MDTTSPPYFRAAPASPVPTGARYGAMFGAATDSGGFASFGEFLETVHSGLNDRRLRATMFEGVDSTGGFLVPPQHTEMLLDASLENEIVRPRAQVHPMQTDELKIAGLDNLDHSSNLYGGFTAKWKAEGEDGDVEDAAVRKIVLKANKMFLLARSSNELIADAPSFDRLLGDAMVAALGWYLDYAFLRGSGSGQPLGALNDPATIEIAKESEQAANTIAYENLTRMLARLHPSCVRNSVWVASPTCIPQLLQLTIDCGTGGSHVPVLSESAGKYTCLTRPVLFTEKLPALGTVGDIMLADFGQYSVGLRKELSVERSGHVGFVSDTSYFRAILRADGRGRWSAPMTPNSGNDLGWCITLASR